MGSTRSITTGSGTGQTPGQICYDADFTPYGQEMSHSERLQTTACPPNYKFTSYERDPETGLDYAFVRYYSSRLGRFLSTDPLRGSVGSLQSHNAYAYVINNPMNLIDPSGMDYCNGNSPYTSGGGGTTNLPPPCQIAPGVYDASYGGSPPNLGPGCWTSYCPGSNGGIVWNEPVNPSAELNAGEARYESIISTGWDPALGINWRNVDYTAAANGQLTRLSGNADDVFGQDAFSLDPGVCTLIGGHCNFDFSCDDWSICGPGRYDDGLHVECAGGGSGCLDSPGPDTTLWIHDDTVSPWTGAFTFGAVFTPNFWVHGFVDLIGGTIFVGAFPH